MKHLIHISVGRFDICVSFQMYYSIPWGSKLVFDYTLIRLLNFIVYNTKQNSMLSYCCCYRHARRYSLGLKKKWKERSGTAIIKHQARLRDPETQSLPPPSRNGFNNFIFYTKNVSLNYVKYNLIILKWWLQPSP